MSRFPVHTVESAPEGSRPSLESLQRGIGMIPNLAASMAESPELLRGFLALRDILNAGTFSEPEIQVLSLTNAFENGCAYCMSLHSTFALKVGVAPRDVEALREERSPLRETSAAVSPGPRG